MEYTNMFKNKRGMHYIMPFVFLVVIINGVESIIDYTSITFIIICIYEFYNSLDEVEIRMSAIDHLGYLIFKLFLESRLSLFILSAAIILLGMFDTNIQDFKNYIVIFLCLKIIFNYKFKVPFEFLGIEKTKQIIFGYKDVRLYEGLYQKLIDQENKAYMFDMNDKRRHYLKKVRSNKLIITKKYMFNLHSNIDMQLYRSISINGDCYSMKVRRWVFQVYYTYLANKYLLKLVGKYGWYEENRKMNFKKTKLETYLDNVSFYVGMCGKQVNGVSKVINIVSDSQGVREINDDMIEVVLKRLCYRTFEYDSKIKKDLEEKLRKYS